MNYIVEFKRTAVKDLKKINQTDAVKIMEKIKSLEEGLKGDIKKLTGFTHEYRLRFGNFRILFETVGNKIIVFRIKHRKESYR